MHLTGANSPRPCWPAFEKQAVPDAGFWWDTPVYGNPSYRKWLQTMEASIVPDVWNATLRGALAKCIAAPPDGNAAKCYTQP